MSKAKHEKYKKKLQKILELRQALLEPFFSEDKMVLGSYMKTRIRCGSPGCHCHKDGGHEAMRISRWENGKLKSKIVRQEDQEWVNKASNQYKAHKKALREVSKLNEEEKDILKKIIELKAQIYE